MTVVSVWVILAASIPPSRSSAATPIIFQVGIALLILGGLLAALIAAMTSREIARRTGAMQEGWEKSFTILNSIPAGIIIIDPQTGQIVEANKAALEAIGAPKRRVVGAEADAFLWTAEEGATSFNEIGDADYSDIKRDYAHVDATCMWMVKNPEWFDVIVTDNMFGDIITDLGAMIQGGMGIAAGGNINPETVSMFEPIGGSAPKYTGKGVINPMAAISACQMMLSHLGEDEAAERVEQAIVHVLSEKLASMQAGKMGYSTSEVGDLVASLVANPA